MIISLISDYQNDNSIEEFDCGNEELNTYFKKYALQNHNNNISKTYLCIDIDNDIVAGYVTLCAASLEAISLPKDYKNLPRYPIPAIRIARLAIDKKYQRQHIGKSLLSFALKKIVVASLNIGIKFALVDAKEESKSFYEKYGFIPLADKPLSYIMPIEQIAKAIFK